VALPALNAEQQQISGQLADIIAQHISANGPMPFSEYMHRCLYEPGLGYYVNGLSKLGGSGDFITAPEISADLARCVAAQTAEVLALIGGGDVLEFGGGSGRFAADLLLALDEMGSLPERYYLLDVSPDLRQQQQQLISDTLPGRLAPKVEWVRTFVEGFRGVAVANELFDAFPVERFRVAGERISRLCVSADESGFHLVEVDDHNTARDVMQLLGALRGQLSTDYQSEFCPVLAPWWASLSDAFDTGLVLVLDYGCERARYYSPLRSGGSTRCFFRHTLHDDALIYPGVQDITADVDFSALAGAAVANRFELEGYTSMTRFMLSCGVMDHHEKKTSQLDEKARIEATGKLKQVLMPEEMGERFMVAGFSRNIGPVLEGFAHGDQSRLL
jgi:SAM-dependent MidA family methyltransferase